MQVADRFGTPTYAYREDSIREQCASLKISLMDLPVTLLYAMKANSNPGLLRIMIAEGLGVDAVSPAEVLLVRRLGLPADKILFSANNVTDAEMAQVHDEGVLFNIGELSRLAKYGQLAPGSDVCLRINPEIGAGHHVYVVTGGKTTKFGIPPTQIPDILAIANRYDLRIVGLHQHIGSGITDTQQLHAAISILLNMTGSFPDLRFLNFGGGLFHPVPGHRAADRHRTLRATRRGPSPGLSGITKPAVVVLVRTGSLFRGSGRCAPDARQHPQNQRQPNFRRD